MASFVETGEHYFKSFDVFKKKSDEFIKNIQIIRDHMPSVIQRLPQERSCLNILSVGSGTGEMDMEILRIVKEEVKRSQGRDLTKIHNRAIEPNEYSCDFYKAAVKSLNDPQINFDIRHQTFQKYTQEGIEVVEESNFDVIHFIHSLYHMDIEESLSHCIQKELSTSGSLFCVVEGVDLIYWVLEKQRFSDWHGSKEVDPVHKNYEPAETISKIAKERGWKHEVYNQEYEIDVTDVFDAESTEGNLLLDFLTHTKNFRDTADKQVVKETLALIKDLSTIKDGRHFGKKLESLILIYK